MRFRLLLLSLYAFATVGALADDRPAGSPPTKPGVIVEGSGNVFINGKPAARLGDTTDDGAPLVEGVPNVTINGRPVVVQGSRTACGGVTTGGATGVFVNGKPIARAGDSTSGCPEK